MSIPRAGLSVSVSTNRNTHPIRDPPAGNGPAVISLPCSSPHFLDAPLTERIPLAEALGRDQLVAAHLDRAAIAWLTEPAHYLGSSGAFIDRIVEAAQALG
jgi:hypothetical protein